MLAMLRIHWCVIPSTRLADDAASRHEQQIHAQAMAYAIIGFIQEIK
jgi:hypothetical protein